MMVGGTALPSARGLAMGAGGLGEMTYQISPLPLPVPLRDSPLALKLMAGYGAGTGSGWVGLSDHRPLLVTFTIPTDHLLLPRFTPSAGQQRIQYLRKFTSSKPQLQQFRDALSHSPEFLEQKCSKILFF